MDRKPGLCLASAVLGGAIFAACAAVAQDYPNKQVRFIVPYTPGGGTDALARFIGENLRRTLGQAVVVDNRPGADGRLGTEILARAAPDGYTIALITSVHSIHPTLFRKLPYDPVKDFQPVTLAGSSPSLLVVHPSLQVKSVKELVSLAKSKPGKLNYGTAGLGQAPHLAGELFKTMAGIDIMNVPFKGGGEVTRALLGGHLEMAFGSIPTYISHVKAGKLKALAITSGKRSPSAPDVPTMVESGFPGFVTATWYGVVAPAGTPKPIVTRLNSEITGILRSPDTGALLQKLGLEPGISTPEEFGVYIKSEIIRWGGILRSAGIRPE